MRIFKIIPIWLFAVIVVAVVVFAMYGNVLMGGNKKTTALTMIIQEVGTENYWEATTYLDEQTFTQSIAGKKVVPLTAYGIDVPTLDPTKAYTITFLIKLDFLNKANLASIDRLRTKVGVAYEGAWTPEKLAGEVPGWDGIVHSGHIQTTDEFKYSYRDETTISPQTPYTTTSKIFSRYFQTGALNDGPLLGRQIQFSQFNVSIHAEATDINGAYASQKLSATITLNIMSPTEINMVISDIETGGI